MLEADLGHELRLMVFPAVAWARRVPLPDGPDLLKLTLAQCKHVGSDGVEVQGLPASRAEEAGTMDQPTAEEALQKLGALVGEWTLEAIPPGGEPWPGEARATIEWHDSGAHLVERSSVEMPEAPDGISLMGCDAANGTYYQLYSDDRGVCRVYHMSIGDGEWKLWREGEPFPQRFTGRFQDDGNTIVGRWELAEDGTNYETDFDLIYRKVK